MPFVKLDVGILNSTLWVERECRELFITALLMAEPYELPSETPQIAVRSLDLTGWMVPPGWYGFVPAAGAGIVRRAIMDPEVGLAALERLGDPDPESRSSDFEGRRLVRVEGGFLVLNYVRYRDKDHNAAERMRRYRAKKAIESNNVRRNGDAERRTLRIADAYADADAYIKKEKKKQRATPLPMDFKISDQVKTWALKKGYADLEPDLEFFIGRMRANGKTYVDWDQAFMNCVNEDWAGLRKKR